MQRDELVALLGQRRRECDALATNLLDLESTSAYTIMKAGGLSGRSGVAATTATEAMARLWSGLETLRAHLTAAERAKDAGWRGNLDEVQRLLCTPSIVVATSVVPAVRRTATGPRDTSVALSFTDLMGQLDADYAAAAAAIGSLTEALVRGGPLLDKARTLVVALGPRRSSALAAALAEAEAVSLADPVALAEQLPALVAAIAAAAAAVDAAQAEQARLPALLAEAEAVVSELEELIGTGADHLAEARAKIADPVGLLEPLDPLTLIDDTDRGLRPWLVRLRATATTDPSAATTGLAAWREVAVGARDESRRIAASNARPVAERNELRGRVEGLAAKARARGEAEQPDVARAYFLARELLWSAPCNLVDAQAAVAAFETVLVAAGDARASGAATSTITGAEQ